MTKRLWICIPVNHHHTRCTAIRNAIYDDWKDYVYLDGQWFIRKNAVRWMQKEGPGGGATMRTGLTFPRGQPRGTPSEPPLEDTGNDSIGQRSTGTASTDLPRLQ